MDGYLPKPIDVERLVEMVERAAERRADQASPPKESKPQPPQRRHTAPSIDYAAALQRLGGDVDLFRKIVSLFDEDAPGLLETIRQSVAAGDPVRLQRAAHSLKGLAANFGAADAMASALRLEEMGKSGDLAGAEEVIGRLAEEIDRLNTDLAPHRRTPAAKAIVSQP